LLLTFVDYCLLLMTLVLHLCSACNRRTINFYMMMMMMMMTCLLTYRPRLRWERAFTFQCTSSRVMFAWLIAQGLSFLHRSPLGSHGRLKTSNVLISSRWILKINGFGLHGLRSAARTAIRRGVRVGERTVLE